jgi:flagellar biosynthesis protein FlhF
VRVKSFQGRSLEEILPEIRSDLGPNAVVLSQKQLIAGGVGGFFGTRMLEVVAADRMPSDEELIDLDDRQYATAGAGKRQSGGRQNAPRRQQNQAPTGGLDLTDDWDPANDDELAAEFGSVLNLAQRRQPPKEDVAASNAAAANSEAIPAGPTSEEIAKAVAAALAERNDAPVERAPAVTPPIQMSEDNGSYQPLEVPRRSATVQPDTGAGQPQVQARQLAARAHQAISEATREIEEQLAYSRSQRSEFPTPAPEPQAVQQPMQIQQPVMPQRVSAHPGTSAIERGMIDSVRNLERSLGDAGVDIEIAQALVSEVVSHRRPFSHEQDMVTLMRDTIAEHIPVHTGWGALGRQHRAAVVGPSGAGKSSVVAKLAEGYSRLSGLKVGIVSILGEREIVNRKELRDDPLLRRPHLDVRFVTNPEQMIGTLEKMNEADVVLIDTPSSAYFDLETFRLVCQCFVSARVDDVHAVIPLATSLREAESVVEYFRGTSLNRLIVSKLDESRYAGQLLNYGFRFGLPITYLSDGPRIPEDMRAASAREIAELIVPHKE